MFRVLLNVLSVLLSTNAAVSSLSHLRVALKVCATVHPTYQHGKACANTASCHCPGETAVELKATLRSSLKCVLPLQELLSWTGGTFGTVEARELQGFLRVALHSQAFYSGVVAKPHHTTSMFTICAISASFARNLDALLSSPGGHRGSLFLGGGSLRNHFIKHLNHIKISLIRTG